MSRVVLEFLLVLVLAAAVRLPWLFFVPMNEAPDEVTHYWVIKFLCEHLRLPTGLEVIAGGPKAVYGSIPQLAYLPHVLFVKLQPMVIAPLAERFGSLAVGILTVGIGRLMGREVFPRSPLLSWAVPLAMTFHPQFVFLHSYANSDSTAAFIAATMLLLVFRALRLGLTPKVSAAIGILAAWLTLSKYSGVAALPGVILGMVMSIWINRAGLQALYLNFAVAATCYGLGCGWWFVRNRHEYPGDMFGYKTMHRTWAIEFGHEVDYHMEAWKIIKEKRWWRILAFSYWGLFGYMIRFMWRPFYLIYISFMVCSAIGGITRIIKWRKLHGFFNTAMSWLTRERTEEEREKLLNSARWIIFSIAPFFSVAAVVRATQGDIGGPQGRYLFPCEIPLISLLIGGLASLKPLGGKKLVIAFLIFNAIVYGAETIVLFRMYGWNPQVL